MSKLKDVSLSTGSGTAKPIGAYTTDHGRTSKMPAIAPVPRADGSMATGETGGNYDSASMSRLPNNSGPRGTQDVADSASDTFANPGADTV